MTLDHIALMIVLLPAVYIIGNRFARHIWHFWLAGCFDKPLPYQQHTSLGSARFKWTCVWKRGAALSSRAFRRRRGMTRARPLV